MNQIITDTIISVLKTDSILLEIKSGCGNFLRPSQIDSLRVLLEAKEIHLFRIMKAVQSWKESDSILTNELPVIATQSVRMKTITKKKKGIAGLFGKKETVQVPYITNEIQDFNERLTSARDWRNNQMEAYADNLRLQNRLLNHKLYDFVSSIDNQIQQSFTEQCLEITETRWNSFRLFAIVINIVIHCLPVKYRHSYFLLSPLSVCPHPCKAWQKKIPERSEDDFFQTTSPAGPPCGSCAANSYFCSKK